MGPNNIYDPIEIATWKKAVRFGVSDRQILYLNLILEYFEIHRGKISVFYKVVSVDISQ